MKNIQNKKNIKAYILLKYVAAFLFLHFFSINCFAQAQLELSNSSYPAAPNGLTLSSQTATFLKNANGSTFSTTSPIVTVTASISNQQYNNIATARLSTGRAINFGGSVNSISPIVNNQPVYNALNSVDNPSNALFTSNPNGPASTGIDIADNYGFSFYNSVDELFTTNAPLSGRYYFGDITLSFNQPVNNPVIHINGLGSNVLFSPTDKQGFSSELELQNAGLSLTKLSGSAELNVTTNKILNNATTLSFNCGAGAACGSVKVNGLGITTLTFKVFVRGDGNGQAWSHNSIAAGDEFMISVSMNAGVNVCGNVFKDANGLIDNTVNGIGTNISNSLFVNLIDSNNKVIAANAVNSNGSYCFNYINIGNYKVVLGTTQGIIGNTALPPSLPASWVNTGENLGASAGSDGIINGILPISVGLFNIDNANFGVDSCYNIIPTATASGSTTACNNNSLILSSSVAPKYQWYRNDTAIIGATSSTYTPNKSGLYFVAVGNIACNNKSNTITVVISVPAVPILTATDTAILCPNASEKVCPLVWGYSNYQWYKDGVLVPSPLGTSSCMYATQPGNYTLAAQDGVGCWSSQSASVYIKIDTSCSSFVSGGGTGGLESKPIGDVISERLFSNAINNKLEVDGLKNGIKFLNSGLVVNGIDDIKLKNLVPTKTQFSDSALISTPSDLMQFTNATEMLAVDYIRNNNVKAVVFATKTLNDVYNHTKPICDRLKGAELIDVLTIKVDNFDLLAYKIKQRTGQTEYAINLSAGTSSNRNSISIQSNWFTNNYIKESNLYNFQIWAVSMNSVVSIAKDIIANLKLNANLYSITSTDLPKAYITKGKRVNTDLVLNIKNNTNFTSGYLEIKEKLNENSSAITKQIPLTINANGISTISIPVKDFYEENINFYINNALTDMVYMSDGTWSFDKSNNLVIDKFNITNEVNVKPSTSDFKIFRNVDVATTSKDFLNVYKTINGGGIEEDLSKYEALLFSTNASGATSVTITLVKKTIQNWNDQYKYTLRLDGATTQLIKLKDFVSSKFNNTINADDITAISFKFNIERGVNTKVNASISNVMFTNNLNILMENSLDVLLYPNPSKGICGVNFYSNAAQSLELKVSELTTGRLVKTIYINAIKGMNKQMIDISKETTNGYYIISLEGDDQKYKTGKLFINK